MTHFFSFFLRNVLRVCVCVRARTHVSVYVCYICVCYICVDSPGGQKKTLDPLALELQVFMNCLIWVLVTNPNNVLNP